MLKGTQSCRRTTIDIFRTKIKICSFTHSFIHTSIHSTRVLVTPHLRSMSGRGGGGGGTDDKQL